jgi:hypothetical protein
VLGALAPQGLRFRNVRRELSAIATPHRVRDRLNHQSRLNSFIFAVIRGLGGGHRARSGLRRVTGTTLRRRYWAVVHDRLEASGSQPRIGVADSTAQAGMRVRVDPVD